MLVKRIPIIFQIGIKQTNIAIYKSLGKSKDQYIHKQHANFQDYIYSKQSLRVLQLRKR